MVSMKKNRIFLSYQCDDSRGYVSQLEDESAASILFTSTNSTTLPIDRPVGAVIFSDW
jgi:hypothetical protein